MEASLPAPSSICSDETNKAQEPLWDLFVCFSRTKDFRAENRVREVLCNWLNPSLPSWHRELIPSVWAHEGTQGVMIGGSERNLWFYRQSSRDPSSWIAAAEASIWEVRAVPTTLVWALTLASSQLRPLPARAAKAFSIYTDPYGWST